MRPRIGYEAKEIHTALGLVAAGLGFTLVGKSVADSNRSDIRFLPVRGVKTMANVFAIRRKGVAHQLADVFLDIASMQSLTR
ncbi:LysR substrate binding domain protein [compost metagenome]